MGPCTTCCTPTHARPPPGWARRIRLALQTAKVLLTLHSACPPVIHCDVKSANVLLDRNLDARLGDFGVFVGNPCSVVDTQGGAISKLRPHGGLNSELRFINEDEIEEPEPSAIANAVEEEKEKEEEEEETLIFAKKPPSAAAKGSRPSRNAKVFSEAGTRESRNLMELMADSSFVSSQRSIISRARTVHLARDRDDKNSLPFLRRNQTVRAVLFEKILS